MSDHTNTHLEPCPFCGVIPVMPAAKSGVWRDHYRVKCGTDNCYGNSAGISAANAMAAAEFWNSRASVAAPQGDAPCKPLGYIYERPVEQRWCITHNQPMNRCAPSPVSPSLVEEVAAGEQHHKHCSSWTVTTSGQKKPCDCVCQCGHTMFEHIRPGEHYWYEDCAVDGCPCMKFAAATPVSLSDAVRKAAEEIAARPSKMPPEAPLSRMKAAFQLDCIEIAAIISRHFTATVVVGEGDEQRLPIEDLERDHFRDHPPEDD